MAESKKAMEQRHAKTLGKIAKEEAQEANEYAKGGAIDGVATKGRTSVEQVKMACGGKAKKYACGGKIKAKGYNGEEDSLVDSSPIRERVYGPDEEMPESEGLRKARAWMAAGSPERDAEPAPRAKPVVRRVSSPTPAAKPEASEVSETPTSSTSSKGFRGHMSDADARPDAVKPKVKYNLYSDSPMSMGPNIPKGIAAPKEPKKPPRFDPANADYSSYDSGAPKAKPTLKELQEELDTKLKNKSYDGALPDEAYLGLGGGAAGAGAAVRAGLGALRNVFSRSAAQAAGRGAAQAAGRGAAQAARNVEAAPKMSNVGAGRGAAANAERNLPEVGASNVGAGRGNAANIDAAPKTSNVGAGRGNAANIGAAPKTSNVGAGRGNAANAGRNPPDAPKPSNVGSGKPEAGNKPQFKKGKKTKPDTSKDQPQLEFAKGGSVKGWGVSKLTNKFKVV